MCVSEQVNFCFISRDGSGTVIMIILLKNMILCVFNYVRHWAKKGKTWYIQVNKDRPSVIE